MIEEIVPQLPKTKDGIKNAYTNYNNKKKFISLNEEEFKYHLEKAKSDLPKLVKFFYTN